MIPVMCPVVERLDELDDVVTIALDLGHGVQPPAPGQFLMLWAFGVGEIPISVSRISTNTVHHPIRRVGRVSEALCAVEPGDLVGVRGPFGTAWPSADDGSETHLIVAGGLGTAPLRPCIDAAAAAPGVEPVVVVGSRTPDQLLYRNELARLAEDGVRVLLTVDQADASWDGSVGFAHRLLDELDLDHRSTTAMLCGPEIMMRAAASALHHRRLPAERIWLSLERNMHCAMAHCGRCQLGPKLLCRDGPILRADIAEPLLQVRDR